MTYPIHNPNVKNNQTTTDEPDLLEDNYGFDYDPELDAGYEDELSGDDIFADDAGDEFIGPEDEGASGPAAPQDRAGVRMWLNDLLSSGQITRAQYDDWLVRVNSTSYLSPDNQAAALGLITSEINAVVAPPAVDDLGMDGDLEGEGGDGTLKGQIEAFIERVRSNDNLNETAKQNFISQAEKLLADYELVKDEPDAQYRIEEELAALEESYTQFLTMPASVQTLADRFANGDTTKVLEAAEAHNIDLSNLPEPPTPEVFEFLKELNPAIAEQLGAVQTAVRDKADKDGEMVERANRCNAANTVSTSYGPGGAQYDTVDWEAFEYLNAAQDFNDSGSAAIAAAASALTATLVADLQALYPDANISTVGSDYKNADLISFGGQTIDVVANKNGELIAGAAGADAELSTPPMVTLMYDWEGDGDWEDKSSLEDKLGNLQDQGYPTQKYD